MRQGPPAGEWTKPRDDETLFGPYKMPFGTPHALGGTRRSQGVRFGAQRMRGGDKWRRGRWKAEREGERELELHEAWLLSNIQVPFCTFGSIWASLLKTLDRGLGASGTCRIAPRSVAPHFVFKNRQR